MKKILFFSAFSLISFLGYSINWYTCGGATDSDWYSSNNANCQNFNNNNLNINNASDSVFVLNGFTRDYRNVNNLNGVLIIENNGVLDLLAGNNVFTVNSNGIIIVKSGGKVVAGGNASITLNGLMIVEKGATVEVGNGGSGTLTINGSGTLILHGNVEGTSLVNNGTLIGTGTINTGTITNSGTINGQTGSQNLPLNLSTYTFVYENATWTPSIGSTIPADAPLEIKDNYTAIDNFKAYSLTIDQNAKLTMSAGKVLIVEELNNLGTIELSASAAGYAQLALPIATVVNAGSFDVQQYYSGVTGWYSISVPVEGATIEDLEVDGNIWLTGGRANFFTWNANAANWEAPAAMNTQLEPGVGYYAYMGKQGNNNFIGEMPLTLSVTGTPVLTNKTVSLGYNDGTNTTTTFNDNTTDGWNLMSNPYPAALDLNELGLPSGTMFYIFQQGQWVSYGGGIGTNGGSQYVAPFQAFFVRVSAAQNFTYTPEMTAAVVNGNNNTPAIFQIVNTKNILRATVTDANKNASDEMVLNFVNGADANAVDGEDGYKLNNHAYFPNFYSFAGNIELAINVRPEATAGDTIQLGFEYATSGQMTIAFDMSEFDARYDVYLLDAHTNTIHNANQAYTFMHDENYPADRFSLVFARNSMNVEANIEKLVDAWVFDNNGEHSLRLAADANVTIYDMNGRSVAQFNGQAGNNALPQLTNGMYIIRLDGAQTLKWVK